MWELWKVLIVSKIQFDCFDLIKFEEISLQALIIEEVEFCQRQWTIKSCPMTEINELSIYKSISCDYYEFLDNRHINPWELLIELFSAQLAIDSVIMWAYHWSSDIFCAYVDINSNFYSIQKTGKTNVSFLLSSHFDFLIGSGMGGSIKTLRRELPILQFRVSFFAFVNYRRHIHKLHT